MKKLVMVCTGILLMIHHYSMYACEICKENQPKVLKNITHGTGPSGKEDYVIICIALIIVVITLVMSIKYLVRPGEQRIDHIKHSILN